MVIWRGGLSGGVLLWMGIVVLMNYELAGVNMDGHDDRFGGLYAMPAKCGVLFYESRYSTVPTYVFVLGGERYP